MFPNLILLTIQAQAEVDSAVLKAVTGAFYSKGAWKSHEWTQGTYLVVVPKYMEPKRADFALAVREASDYFKEGLREAAKERASKKKRSEYQEKELTESEKYFKGSLAALTIVSQAGSSFPPMVPFGQLKIDEPAVVSDAKREWRTRRSDWMVKAPSGNVGSVRTSFRFQPPGYSADGQFAVIKGDAPWSIHHADLNFFLTKKPAGWEILCVQVVYYV